MWFHNLLGLKTFLKKSIIQIQEIVLEFQKPLMDQNFIKTELIITQQVRHILPIKFMKLY